MNIRLGETALEILAWDRYRTVEPPGPQDLAEIDGLVHRGAGCHRRLLATVHGEREDRSLAESDAWLRESRERWKKRPSMTEKGGFLRGPRLRLIDEDLDRLDRIHPETSFSARTDPGAGPGGDDLVEKLERLGALRSEGLLEEDEFQTAKARLLEG
ncbi:MAG TPA: hypothetical protein VMH33_06820 [Solirubrobacterales bacterium]|nr:hypothetical protein [Solirubrobacterales bacterium]